MTAATVLAPVIRHRPRLVERPHRSGSGAHHRNRARRRACRSRSGPEALPRPGFFGSAPGTCGPGSTCGIVPMANPTGVRARQALDDSRLGSAPRPPSARGPREPERSGPKRSTPGPHLVIDIHEIGPSQYGIQIAAPTHPAVDPRDRRFRSLSASSPRGECPGRCQRAVSRVRPDVAWYGGARGKPRRRSESRPTRGRRAVPGSGSVHRRLPPTWRGTLLPWGEA